MSSFRIYTCECVYWCLSDLIWQAGFDAWGWSGCQEKSTKYRFKLFVPSILAFHSGSLNYEQSIHLIFIHIQQPTPNTHPLIHSHGPFAALLFLRSANKAEPPTAAVLNPPCRKSKNKRERKRSHVINAYVLLHRLWRGRPRHGLSEFRAAVYSSPHP